MNISLVFKAYVEMPLTLTSCSRSFAIEAGMLSKQQVSFILKTLGFCLKHQFGTFKIICFETSETLSIGTKFSVILNPFSCALVK